MPLCQAKRSNALTMSSQSESQKKERKTKEMKGGRGRSHSSIRQGSLGPSTKLMAYFRKIITPSFKSLLILCVTYFSDTRDEYD